MRFITLLIMALMMKMMLVFNTLCPYSSPLFPIHQVYQMLSHVRLNTINCDENRNYF